MQFFTIRSVRIRPSQISISCLSTKPNRELIKACKILGISETPTANELKEAFLKLAKKYHPDSGSLTADSEKFAKIQAAYKLVRENLLKQHDGDDVKEVLEKDFGIKHTVPQHRRYLTNEGVGYGTPSQRQRQYEQHKVTKTVERVYNYRMEKMTSQHKDSLILKDASLARQYKTSQAMERLVEDLIQESMARGEFDNLPGSGKPLKYTPEIPYVDSMTYKLNQILINNGFIPEWVVLEQEIKKEQDDLRNFLKNERNRLNNHPLSNNELNRWKKVILDVQYRAKSLNVKIDKFNMVVPISKKQKLHFQLEKEAEKILKMEQGGVSFPQKCATNSKSRDEFEQEGFFSFFWNIFR